MAQDSRDRAGALYRLLSYRAALMVVAGDVYAGTAASTVCAEGKVPRPLFDALTGLPAGVVYGCADSGGGVAVIWGPVEVDLLYPHWARAALFGIGGAALALILIWLLGQRRSKALRRQSEAPATA